VLVGGPGWSSDRPCAMPNRRERMRDVLVDLGGFYGRSRRACCAIPDTNEVRATLRDSRRNTQGLERDTLVFFYYSGHADNEHVHLRGDALRPQGDPRNLRSCFEIKPR